MADDLAAFAKKMHKLSAMMTGASLVAVANRVGMAAKRSAQTEARAATGDGRLSRYGRGRRRGGVTIAARYAVSNGGERIEVVPTPASRGAWKIIEEGAGAHEIGREGRRLSINGVVVTAPVGHPGARGKQAWSKAAHQMERDAPAEVDRAVRRELSQLF